MMLVALSHRREVRPPGVERRRVFFAQKIGIFYEIVSNLCGN